MGRPGPPPRIDTLDLEFQGTPHVIASFLIHGPAGPVLVESGPASTLPVQLDKLERHGVRPHDVRDVLVTHIHLDHAGAAGHWARRGARVFVHPMGAPHLIDPGKLLASAARIYGDRMQALWGEVVPAPAERVVAVPDGAVIEAGGLRIRALEAPGHAWHHHVYILEDLAFAGDAAGIQLPANTWIDLPAPPPEFDLEAWKTTLGRLRTAGLRTLYRTHFGATSDVEVELDRFERLLEQGVAWIREMTVQGLDREAMIAKFGARMRAWATRLGTAEADAHAYELANPRSMSVDGISRYLRKRDAQAGGAKDTRSFALRYTAAWCSRNPAAVAAFFAERGSLKINDGEPHVGRAAITAAARGFMRDFPDLAVSMSGLERDGTRWLYHWTLTGTHAGTGNRVEISGHEAWTLGPDGLVAESLGHFDAADYERQVAGRRS